MWASEEKERVRTSCACGYGGFLASSLDCIQIMRALIKWKPVLKGISAVGASWVAQNNVLITNLLDKGNITFNNNDKQKRFRLLNFPRGAILDFMTSLRCLYCWKAEVLLFETIGQRSDVIKSKMADLRWRLFGRHMTSSLYVKTLAVAPGFLVTSLMHFIPQELLR